MSGEMDSEKDKAIAEALNRLRDSLLDVYQHTEVKWTQNHITKTWDYFERDKKPID